jgi:DNA-binding response OmpR family regulator
MHIAIVDDDETILRFVSRALEEDSHRCTAFRSGRSFLSAISRETFDLLIVDWNMPEMSGIEIIQSLNAAQGDRPPIIMLTSRAEKEDIAAALNQGADDFIVKPESPVVISARVNALLRRSMGNAHTADTLRFGSYMFDRRRNAVTFSDRDIVLTSKEFALALLLFMNQSRPLSRSYIMEAVWKSLADLSTRTLDMHISRIRTKLSLRSENGFCLRTVFGYGYRLEPSHEND